MSFQDNRFPIALGSMTAVAVGVLGWWGMKSGDRYEVAHGEYSDAASEIARITKGPTYPNAENLQAKTKAVGEYRAAVDELQKAFDKYRAPKLTNVAVDTFTDTLIASRDSLVKKFEASNTELPQGPYLGLAKYTTEPAKKSTTGLLNYQLEAFGELFGMLADAKPKAINNVYRTPLPEESGKKFDAKGKNYRAHTIEVSFTAREDSVRKFLSALDDSEKFFYSVRVMRVKNDRATAPNAKDARFEQPKAGVEASDPFGGGGADPFGGGGFVFPEDDAPEGTDDGGGEVIEEITEEVVVEPVDTGPTDSGEILKQVLGSEQVQVFLCIDVLQFLDPKSLPKS